jgi:hypothetical protein
VSAYWMKLTTQDGMPIEVNILRYCEMRRYGNETRLFTGDVSNDAYCTKVKETPALLKEVGNEYGFRERSERDSFRI